MKLVTARISVTPHGPGIGASQVSRGVPPVFPGRVTPRVVVPSDGRTDVRQALAAIAVAERCRTAHRVRSFSGMDSKTSK